MKLSPYTNYQDEARLEYSRLLWKTERNRALLLAHWTDPRHPHRERFQEHESLVREVLGSPSQDDEILDASLRKRGSSLRTVVREIPTVFGSYWADTCKRVADL